MSRTRASCLQLEVVHRTLTVHGVSWERATGDWSCHVRDSLGSGGGGEELGDGKVGHARGADLGQVGEQVQAVHPAGRRDRQHGAGKPCTTRGLRAETPLAPQAGRPDARSATLLVGSTPGTSRYAQRAGHRWSMRSDSLRTLRP